MEAIATPDLNKLLVSWKISLKADRKSPQTIDSYTTGVRLFLRWCEEHDREPSLSRDLVRAWVSYLLAGGAEPATARSRQMALKRFSAWLEEEDIENDNLATLKPPKLDTKVVECLTDDECARLVKACVGKSFVDRRDEAITRLMLEVGLRAGEVLGLTMPDIDLARGVAVVRRGKGGKGRTVPVGPHAARSIDRYLRMRSSHRLATTEPLWLGDNGQGLHYHGLRVTMRHRAEAAGIKDFHLHKLRHTAATRWLTAGGSENGLLALAGWSSRAMLDRYTKSTQEDRAAAESRRLNLGEF